MILQNVSNNSALKTETALVTFKRTFRNCVYNNNKIMHEANFG
jgi:hypothetical protein